MKSGKLVLTAIISTMISSCTVFSVTRSPAKEVLHERIVISPDCNVSSTGAIFMNVAGIIKRDFLPASFKIVYKDKLIYIDPVMVDDTTKADYIFITHSHPDHFSLPDIKKLSDDNTLIIAPKPVIKKLDGFKTQTVSLGDSIVFEEIKVEILEAYNVKKKPLSMVLHKRCNDNVGYVINCDTIRIYHAGDTDLIPEMKNLKNISLALLPIGSGNTSMNPQTAAEAANLIKAQIVVPMHYDIGTDSEYIFSKLTDKNIKVNLFRKNKK